MIAFLNLFSNKLRTTAVLSFFCLSILTAGNAFATDWYVALTGNDQTNTGQSADSPYRTIQKASDVAQPGDIVYVREGIYREQVDIKANGVTFQPYNGETVTINSTEIMTNWTLESGSTYKTTMSWDVDPIWGTNQVFQDGTMIELARWPDQTSSDIIMPTNASAENVVASGSNFMITDDQFNEPAGRWVGAKIWINLSRVGIDGQGSTGTVIAHSGNTITFSLVRGARFGNQPWSVGPESEYFLFDPTPAGVAASGGVDALLSPGEWWKDGNTLYVKTRNGGAPNATGSNVIEAKKRHFAFWSSTTRAGYTIKDFNLFACSVTTDKEAKNNKGLVEAAHDITIDGLKVKYVSHQTVMSGDFQSEHYTWTGIVLSGRNNTLQNCDIQYSATSAVSTQGFGNKILNNRIYDTNYMVSNSGALNTGFSSEDVVIGHNKMWNTTQMHIYFPYARNSNPAVRDVARIHHNEVFDFMRRAGDSGAIDMVGADLQWMRIDHNIIYNTLQDASDGEQKAGIYLDFGGADNKKIRATVDHNIVYNVSTPVLINDGMEVNLFNNVLLTNNYGEAGKHAVGNYNDANNNKGLGVRMFNNIMSHGPNMTGCCGDFSRADIRNNITNARGEVLNDLFVNAANHDYRLKPTAAAAIDKGFSVAPYDENVQGPPDLGAFEWGTFLSEPDMQAPSVPDVAGFVSSKITTTSFDLTWEASTDNVGVAYYEVYANGKLIKGTDTTSVEFKRLTPSTSYFITVVAVDGSGNRSVASERLEVKTILKDLSIAKTATAPVIDGAKEATWSSPMHPFTKVFNNAPTSAADLSGTWTSLWDNNNLYFYIDVNDDAYMVDSGDAWWEDDHVEIYIDAAGTRPSRYGDNQIQYAIRRGGNQLIVPSWKSSFGANTQVSNVEKPNGKGYWIEVKIPFATLGVTAENFKMVGIEVQIGDDDENGGSEDTRLGWHSDVNQVFLNPSLMAVVQLIGSGPADTTPPSVPTNLRASGFTATGFTLSWNASTDDNSGVGSYEVFQNGNLFATTYTNSISLTELDAATTSVLTVRSKDRVGNLSAMSSVLNVTTPAATSELILQAEDAAYGRFAILNTEHEGYTGTGSITIGHWAVGAFNTFTVDNVPEAGDYLVRARYSSAWGNAPISVYVNGVKVKTITFNHTGDWKVWRSQAEFFTLQAGRNTITYQVDAGNGTINLDYIAIFISPGADSKAPIAPTNLAASSVTNSGFTLGWTVATDNSGVIAGYDVLQDNTSIGTTTTTTFNVSSLLPGTTYRMTVKAKDAVGNESDASQVLYVTTSATGAVIREYWANIAGTAVSNIPVNTKPTSVSAITSLEDPTPSSYDAEYNNFGQRIRGYIIPSTTATYYFYIASDNNGEFWLSSDEKPANKALIAQLKGSTGKREWTKDMKNQKSAGITLVAGRKYYFEALMKESGGNNNLSIGWTTDTNNKGITVVGSSNLAAYVESNVVTAVSVNPTTASIVTGKTKQLTASVSPANATNPTVYWSSSNPVVATVSNTGLVTGVGIGTATITTTSADGSNQTATSVITVNRAWTKVDNTDARVTYDANWRMWQGNRGYQGTEHSLINHSLLSEASFSFTGTKIRYYGATRYDLGIADVYLDGVKVATVDLFGQNGEEVYDKLLYESGILPMGPHTLTIKATNTTNQSPSSAWNTAKGTNIFIDAFEYSTSVCTDCQTTHSNLRQVNAEEQSIRAIDLGLMLHPNPANNEVTINLAGFAEESAVQVKMTDMNGKLFVTEQVQPSARGNQITIPINHLPQGLFFVTVQGSKTTKTAKLVITK
jgi:chitodextrinase